MSDNPVVDWIKSELGLGGKPRPGNVLSVTPKVSVTLAPDTLVLDQPSAPLSAIGSPAGGTFSWSNSAPGVVTLSGTDAQSTVQPLASGSATITVTYTVGGQTASATSTITVPVRNFLIVVGDQGKGVHNLGKLPQMAADTHLKELKANTPPAPGIPQTLPSDTITVSRISTVSDLVARLNVNNVFYLAYFGHGWNDTGSAGAINIGQDHAVDTNLTIAVDPPGDVKTCTSPSVLPKAAFLPGAVVFLFACRCSWGTDSIAEQMHDQLSIPVSGYDNGGGSIFTNDKTLGHGQRAVTQADQSKKNLSGGDVWMVPWDGTPHFKTF